MNNSFYLKTNKTDLCTKSAFHTAKEIQGQPGLWLDIWEKFSEEKKALSFLEPVLSYKNLQVVLTGAGSSAFIGETIENYIGKSLGKPTRAIATTTLVTDFLEYIDIKKPLLLISFARSGNSPESIAVVDLAEKLCKKVNHVAITCNSTGKLAQNLSKMENAFTAILPQKANDKSLAMTGSFTGMMLTALILAGQQRTGCNKKILLSSVEVASKIIQNDSLKIKRIADLPFERIIFLGSGPLLGIARESHLKVQELTDGIVVGNFDSFLGFRHGPKAIINEKTLIVCLFSPNKNAYQYEKDLFLQIHKDGIAMKIIKVFPSSNETPHLNPDEDITLDIPNSKYMTGIEILPYVILSQILGFHKSLQLGLEPDSPSKNGSISRVVKGVKIYST